MIIYGAIIIPIVLTIASVVLWKKQFVWWEVILPVIAGLVLVLISKQLVESVACRDKEYWGGWVTTASYYEEWDEEVPCTHAKYRTETDSDGNTTEVFDGYEHAYDVDDHPPYWEMFDSNGERTSLTQGEYGGIKAQCRNEKFIDLHRSYHSKDGDQYKVDAPGGVIIPVVKQHTYENRIMASSSIYKPKKLTEEDRKKIYDYPKSINSYFYPSLLGWAEGTDELAKMNAQLGRAKEVRAMILVYTGKGQEVFQLQRDAWVNGNKNEFVTCIGIDQDKNITWVDCFCWENESLRVSARNYVADKIGKRIDTREYVKWLELAIKDQWKRKHFADFNYLTVEPPWWAILIVYIIVTGTSVGILLYGRENEFTADGRKRSLFDRNGRIRFR